VTERPDVDHRRLAALIGVSVSRLTMINTGGRER
jgi:hypothetical protein